MEKGQSAYPHWWMTKERRFFPDDIEENFADGALPLVRATPAGKGWEISKGFFSDGSVVPMPKGSQNKSPRSVWDEKAGLELSEKLPEVEDDTVIVGIVDTGITLGHRRLRTKKGKTRFIASWQQTAPFAKQMDLPCGQELYASDIDSALLDHSGGDLTGYLDEETFNRALCLTEPVTTLGQRDLEGAAAHGAHVLDLAAGLDPEATAAEELERQRLIAVNLPTQYAHGSAGNFLAYFAVYAVERIIHVADALWLRNHPEKELSGVVGYPVVINFSYGMLAGPKDGNHIFEAALEKILSDRKERAKGGEYTMSPVRIMMPVGNDNLMRGAASAVMGEKGGIHKKTGYKAIDYLELPWRIKPADSTANFVEIWTEGRDPKAFNEMLQNLRVTVSPPGMTTTPITKFDDRTFYNLGDFARLYVEHQSRNNKTRLALLVCVAPTTLDLPNAPLAPAGAWTVNVQYDGAPLDISFYIQSDQSAVRGSKTGKRSYFDHEKYETHLENGALADTFLYESKSKKFRDENDNWMENGPVQRQGSHNALSTSDMVEMITVGGYDDSDGFPAHYSSSTDGDRTKPKGIEILTLSYPSENAASYFGLLAAGARDGSVTAYRGTSMATALATRDAVLEFCKHGASDFSIGTKQWFQKRARKRENSIYKGGLIDRWGQRMSWPTRKFLKSGFGRMPSPHLSRSVSRLGQD